MIHSRTGLVDWIKKNVTDAVLRTAIAQGSVEVLGGFEPLPTSTNPGWMVQVVSPFGKTHLIAVGFDQGTFRLYWFRAPTIPWHNWIGWKSDDPLYCGDKPKLYEQMKLTWEGSDPRFNRIARCAGVYPEADGSEGDAGSGSILEKDRTDRSVFSPPTSQGPVHDERKSG